MFAYRRLLLLASLPALSHTPPRKGFVEVPISLVFRPFKGLPDNVHPPLKIEVSFELISDAMEGKSKRFTYQGAWKDPGGSFVHIWKEPATFSIQDLGTEKGFQIRFKPLDIQIKDSSGKKVLRYGAEDDGPMTTIKKYPKSFAYVISPESLPRGGVSMSEDISEEVQ